MAFNYGGIMNELPRIEQEKILIVDDEKIITDSLKILLAKVGNVECAANGYEALEKLTGKYYAAIITDINMPVMNGIEFYNKAVEAYPNIKNRFLFYTGFSDTKYISFLEKNNLRYLSKPSGIKDIKKVINEIISG